MSDFAAVPRTPPTVLGISRGPENVQAIRVVDDVRDKFYRYMPSATPIITISEALKRKRGVSQRKFDWLTQDEYPRFLDVAAAFTAVAVTINVNAGQGVRVPQFAVLQSLATGELVRVTAVVTDALTVTRGVGSVAVAGEAGHRFQILGIAAEDGTGKTNFKTAIEATEFNYTQIIKRATGFTGRQLATKMYGGKDPVTTRQNQATEWAKDQEKFMLWGRRSLTAGTATTHEITTMGGIDQFVTQTWNVGVSEPTERTVTEVLEFAMKWGDGGNLNGNGKKFLFTSARWTTIFEFFGKDKVQETPGSEKVLGMSVKAYKSTHGTLFIVPCHILDESHPDTAFLLDMNHIAKVDHDDRPPRLVKGIEDNDLDGSEEQYICDSSVEVSLPDAHMKWVGLPL